MTLENPPAQNRSELAPLAEVQGSGPNLLSLLDYKLPPVGVVYTPASDSSGHVHFPPIYGAHRPVDSLASASAASKPASSQTHDYTVKNGDSLWRIAVHSLNHGQRHCHLESNQIWDRMREIVDANRGQHPEIKRNPFFIKKGDHLVIPGEAAVSPAATSARPLQVAESGSNTGRGAHTRHAALTGQGRQDAVGQDAVSPTVPSQPIAGDNGHLANALKTEAAHQAKDIYQATHKTGDCARGPRQTLEHFGIKLQPMGAVAQGQLLEKSGLFDKVPANEVQAGDYGYRHWSAHTIKRRGLGDLGDSFIVTNCSRQGWEAANDHMFQVPPAGGYYAPGISFLRPNAKFYAAYDHYKQTGQMTRLDA